MVEKRVLFVCLGNICRSPIAEAVFLHLIKQRGDFNDWKVDSAAIGPWHVGKSPDHRALLTLEKHNVPYKSKARQIQPSDFVDFDYIFGMDHENIKDLQEQAAMVAAVKAKILLLGEQGSEQDPIIRDPYYDHNAKGFEECFQKCLRCCTSFLKQFQ